MRLRLPASTALALALALLPASAQNAGSGLNVPTANSGSGGGGGGSGTVTSVATACGVAGGPITTSGTITGNITANDPASGSAYTFLVTDCGKLVSFSDATARAPSLPSASFAAGNFINIANTGAGAQTITPTAGTICGAATLVLQQNQGAGVAFDGTNWQCSGGPYAPVNSGTIALARMPTVLGAPGSGYITGASMWYPNPYFMGSTLSTGPVSVANQYYAIPFWLYQTVTIKALGLRVITTSTGNSSAALQAAVYSDLVTTGNVHRPGALIDFTANFATGSAASVSAAMNNGTDTLTGPGIVWLVVQKFDGVATFSAIINTTTNGMASSLGSAALASVVGANPLSSVNAAGTGYGGVNWVNFTSSTTWNENVGTIAGPQMAIQVN